MQEQKPWYQSKTIIGIVITLLSSLAAGATLFGLDLGIGEVEITALVTSIFTVIGTVLSIIGRLKAEKSIGTK